MQRAVLYTKPLPDYLLALLAQKVPAYGLPIVTRVVRAYDFGFRFAAARRSKLGDFTRSAQAEVTLTVNADLSSELFLVTFLHEIAHLEATLGRTRREAPHGKRWQTCFGLLLQELCADAKGQMDEKLRQALLLHSKAPAATMHADTELASLLLPPVEVDANGMSDGFTLVANLLSGTPFSYRGRAFLLSGKLVKRHCATELKSGKLYHFSAQCRVRVLEPQFQPKAAICLAQDLSPGQEFIHRSRRLKLEHRSRSRVFCLDLATGRQVELHSLMHVAI